MARKYFDQLVVSGAKQKGAKRKLSVPVSLGIHAFVIGGIILVPLLITPDLPAPAKGAINAFFVEAAAPPPPPPPPPAAAAPKQAQVKPKIEQPKIVPQEEPKFVAPIETPPEVPEETAVDPGLGEGEGVPEGVVGGVPEGVVGGVPEGVPGGVLGGVPGGEVGGTGGGDAPAPEPSPEPPSGPVRVGGQIKAPSKLKDVAPKYSDMARQARVQGVVVLECVISPDGRVTNVKVLRGSPLLDASAVEAVKQWVYSPTLLNGQPVAVIMTVTVNFKLS
jgi:periplasmic protein TonB